MGIAHSGQLTFKAAAITDGQYDLGRLTPKSDSRDPEVRIEEVRFRRKWLALVSANPVSGLRAGPDDLPESTGLIKELFTTGNFLVDCNR